MSMILSIPLNSMPLLVAAGLVALGFIAYPISARAGVLAIGAGSVIMGGVVMTDLPSGMELPTIALFGITVVVGGWMMYVAVRNG